MLTVESKFRLRMWTSDLSFPTKLLQHPVSISLMSIHGWGLFPSGTQVWSNAVEKKNPAQLVKWQDQIIKFSNLSGAEAYSAKCQDIIFRMAFPYLMPATFMEQLNTF